MTKRVLPCLGAGFATIFPMKTANPSFAMMQKAVSLHQKGQISEAERSYRAVLAADPRHIDALRLLGGLYVQSNKTENAVECFEKALDVNPNHPELLNNLGVALYSQGKVSDALLRYQKAIEMAPNYHDAMTNLGNVFYACGKLDDAIVWLERSVCLQPKDPRNHIALGHAFRMQKKNNQAILHYKQALDLAPDTIEVLTNLGNMLRDAGQSQEACILYQRLAELKPTNVGIRLNLGTIFHDMGKMTEAMEQYEKVLKLQPNAVDAVISRASLLLELDRPEEARAGYAQALSLNPHSSDAKWGQSLAALMLGDYVEGWELYESRFECKPMRNSIPFRESRWDGTALVGKRLLIWGEQGLGDVLQFIRYAALCKGKGGEIIVLCREPLVRLLRSCPFIDRVVTTATKDDFDFHVPIMSLPYVFGTTLDTLPCDVPYLSVSDDVRRAWATRFMDSKDFKIGLVWAGNPRKSRIDAHVTDRQRSMGLALLKPILDLEGCRFYNLQKDEAAREMDVNNLGVHLIDYMPDVNDMMDTAAIIENLDLVISVDTSVVHLAGGLGKTVWVLSRFGGCWRWLRNQETNPWYPTARVFGQPAPGDWEGCVAKIALVLQEFLKARAL